MMRHRPESGSAEPKHQIYLTTVLTTTQSAPISVDVIRTKRVDRIDPWSTNDRLSWKSAGEPTLAYTEFGRTSDLQTIQAWAWSPAPV